MQERLQKRFHQINILQEKLQKKQINRQDLYGYEKRMSSSEYNDLIIYVQNL